MPKSKRFGQLLSRAVRAIAAQEVKTLATIQDELGYHIGRGGGSAIDYWRRGYAPALLEDLEQLIEALASRADLDRTHCEQLLISGHHPQPETLLDALYPAPAQTGQTMALKPFVVGPPVTHPRQFFGRRQALTEIFSLWQRYPLENMAILGLRRSGKTSLLYYLKTITTASREALRPGQTPPYLPQAECFRWVLVDFLDPRYRRQARLFHHILTELKLPVPEPCNQDTFLDTISRHLHQPAVIMMDELEAGLAAPDLDQDFWWTLRTAVSHQTRGLLAFILTAAQDPMRLASDQGKSSPFFNIFHSLELGPLTEVEAHSLIASAPRPFASDDVAWILQQSGCWPSLLQVLCRARLLALEQSQPGPGWRQKALDQLKPYEHLL